jgi:hypothetical protein
VDRRLGVDPDQFRQGPREAPWLARSTRRPGTRRCVNSSGAMVRFARRESRNRLLPLEAHQTCCVGIVTRPNVFRVMKLRFSTRPNRREHAPPDKAFRAVEELFERAKNGMLDPKDPARTAFPYRDRDDDPSEGGVTASEIYMRQSELPCSRKSAGPGWIFGSLASSNGAQPIDRAGV